MLISKEFCDPNAGADNWCAPSNSFIRIMQGIQRVIALVVGLVLVTGVAVAQGSITGKVVDGSNAPLGYATVTLLKTDSTVAGGDLTKDNGTFSISPVGVGDYLLRVESLGFQTLFQKAKVTAAGETVKAGTLKLQTSEQTLKTVNITAEKRVMEMKVDKKVFNVEKNTTTAGGSATDVLQNVPAVSVDMEGNVNLRGKGNVTVLIDGKPATMLGSDVTSALQSLPAASIESVEVITNPSARYDAQGTTGIINIITKKDGRLGMNGSATIGAGTRDKYNGSVNLNVRKGKWNAFVNSSFRINNTFNNVTTDKQDSVLTNGLYRSYYTYEHVPRLFNGLFNTIGGTYDFDKNNSLTVTQNINVMQWGFSDYSNYYIYSNPERTGTVVYDRYRYSDMLGGPVSLSSSVDYKHKFKKKGEELNIDGTYAITNMRRTQDYLTEIDTLRIKSTAPGAGRNTSLNAWADYTLPVIGDHGKFGAGVKTQIFTFYSDNDPKIDTASGAGFTRQGDVRFDTVLYTTYKYNQQIHAAYVNWADQIGKIGYQLGLRGEYALYEGEGRVPTFATFRNEFLNLFPSAFVSYQLPKDQSIYVNYSRRTNRPSFFQMMPFKDFSNPGTVSMGNPDILPEFIDNFELSYSRNTPKGHTYMFSTYFARTANLSERVLRPITNSALDSALGLSNEVGQLLSRPMNIASGTTYGLEATARMQFSKAWDATANVNFFNNELKVGDMPADYRAFVSNTSGYGWFAKLNSNLKLPKDFSLQLTGNYESPRVITQGEQRESYWIDLALKKNLWKNKATLVINCSDVMKTRQFINDYRTPTYVQTINRVKETRIGNITFTYRFGKQDMQGRGGAPGGRGGAKKSRAEKPSDADRASNLKGNDDDNSGGGGGAPSGGQKR